MVNNYMNNENKTNNMSKTNNIGNMSKRSINKKFLIYDLTTCALFAALMCIFGPMSVPIGVIPISLTNLVIYLAVYLLGTRESTISYLIYLLLGAVGLPVFSQYSGGLGKLLGPTGGYLIGFIFMTIISGVALKLSKANVFITALGMAVGTVVAYAFGTAWFVKVAEYTWTDALAVCVYPFIPFDLGKIVIASILGKTVRAALTKAGLLPELRKNKKEKE